MTFARGSCHRLVVTAQPSAALRDPQPGARCARPSRMPTVLLIDDNPAVRTALEVLLSLQGLGVVEASGPDEGLHLLAKSDIDLVIQDMNFRREATSGEEGVVLFHRIRKVHPDLPIILLTAWTHLETAVDLVKAGAADYLSEALGRHTPAHHGAQSPATALGDPRKAGAGGQPPYRFVRR